MLAAGSKPVAPLHIFIFGPFRSLDGSKKDFNTLIRLREHLTRLGYDAFLSTDRDEQMART